MLIKVYTLTVLQWMGESPLFCAPQCINELQDFICPRVAALNYSFFEVL